MLRPPESNIYLSLLDEAHIEYDSFGDTLKPDEATDGMAYIAATLINEQFQSAPKPGPHLRSTDDPTIAVAELGASVAPFSSLIAQRVLPNVALQLTCVDTDDRGLDYARYNVTTALQERDNPHDSIDIRQADWNEVLGGTESYDVVYFNPPYLTRDEVVRKDFKKMAPWAMFVEDDDSFVCYREVLPKLPDIMKPGGLAFIRTQHDSSSLWAVFNIAKKALKDSPATLHQMIVEMPLHNRGGCGLIIDFRNTEPRSFKLSTVVQLASSALEVSLEHFIWPPRGLITP